MNSRVLKPSFYHQNDFPDHLPKLKDLYDDLFAEGKGFRSKLVQMVSKHLPIDEKTMQSLCSVIEYIHNSSLLHDDLIDKSPLRRGKTAAWLKYSPEYAVLAGDYLLAKVIHLLCRDTNLPLVSFTSQTIMDLLEGEWLQDTIKKDPQIDFEKIDTIHELKTASLKKWCLRAPFYAIDQNAEEIHIRLDEVGKIMGLLFQRADDLLDYNIRNSENKAILGDHRSGYLNSFAIYLLKNESADRREAFLRLEHLEQIHDFIGTDTFEEQLQAFDAWNEQLIERFDVLLAELYDILPEEQKTLSQELAPIAKLLYWR